MKYQILIVDDEPANLRMLERLFSDQYEVFTAASGEDGLKCLTRHDIALIISDQRMPGMDGLEFLNLAADLRSQTVRIMLTGYTDVDTLVNAINSGVVYKYVTKPWVNPQLQQTVKRSLEYYETVKTRSRLEQENARLQARTQTTLRGFVNLAFELLSVKGRDLTEHLRRTASYALALGKALEMEQTELDRLFMAGLLHEIPLLNVSPHLLARSTPLSGIEITAIQEGFKHGIKLIANIPDLEEVACTISFQHDHFDGHDSPNSLSGDQIPLHSRILAIADAYDSMRQPTKNGAFDHNEALMVLRSAAGRLYDPELVALFCGLRIEIDEPTPQSEPMPLPTARTAQLAMA